MQPGSHLRRIKFYKASNIALNHSKMHRALSKRFSWLAMSSRMSMNRTRRGDDDEDNNISDEENELSDASDEGEKDDVIVGSTSINEGEPVSPAPGKPISASSKGHLAEPISSTSRPRSILQAKQMMRSQSRGSMSRKSSINMVRKRTGTDRRRSLITALFRRSSTAGYESGEDEDDYLHDDSCFHIFGWMNLEGMRKRIKVFMTSHILGILYTRIMMILSVFSGAQLIYQCYFQYEPHLSYHNQRVLSAFRTLEILLSGMFFLDWILAFFLAGHKIEFVRSFYSMVDLFTCIPIIFTFYVPCPSLAEIDSFFLAWIYLMYALNTSRLLRSLRLRRYLLTIENEVWRHLGEMCLVFIVMILFDAALMQFLESYLERGISFNTWLYYTFVTLTTVGYGDITPQSVFGRFAAMGYIFMAITVVPSMTNALVSKMSATSIYARNNFFLRQNTAHIIICGDLGSTMLSEFFSELFHEGIYIEIEYYSLIFFPLLSSK